MVLVIATKSGDNCKVINAYRKGTWEFPRGPSTNNNWLALIRTLSYEDSQDQEDALDGTDFWENKVSMDQKREGLGILLKIDTQYPFSFHIHFRCVGGWGELW